MVHCSGQSRRKQGCMAQNLAKKATIWFIRICCSLRFVAGALKARPCLHSPSSLSQLFSQRPPWLLSCVSAVLIWLSAKFRFGCKQVSDQISAPTILYATVTQYGRYTPRTVCSDGRFQITFRRTDASDTKVFAATKNILWPSCVTIRAAK